MFDDEETTSPDLAARLPMREIARRCVLCTSSVPFEHKGCICEDCRSDIAARERNADDTAGESRGVYRDTVDFGAFR